MDYKSKADLMIKEFGGDSKFALRCALEVFSVRSGLKGRSYTTFVRHWTMIIHELEKS